MTVETAPERLPLRGMRLIVVAIAVLLAVAATVNAIVYLVALVQWPVGVAAWILLVVSAVFPWVTLLIALLIGRRRPVGELALVLLAGFGLAMVFWMNALLYALVPIFG